MASVSFVNTPTSSLLNFPATANARAYNGYYTVAALPKRYLISKSPSNQLFVTSLTPSTLYNFFINVINSSNVSTLTYTASTTLPAASLAAFSKLAFPEIIPNIKTLVTANGITKEAVISSVFANGDIVAARTLPTTINLNRVSLNATVLKLNANAVIAKNSKILIPFDSTVVSAQSANLTSSTGTTIPLLYNTDNTVTINGTIRSVGNKFFLDGQYITVAAA